MEETQSQFELSPEDTLKASETLSGQIEIEEAQTYEKPCNEQEKISASEEPQNTEKENKFGKFKDADALFHAYNSLQAEFTKKCQMLSDIKKQDCDNGQPSVPATEEDLPQYSRAEWNDKLSKFLSENQEAKSYSAKISNILLNNPTLAKSENALEVAWAKVLIEEQKNQQKLSDSEYITNYLNSNPEAKNKIIQEYVKEVSKNKTPNLISKESSGFALARAGNVTSLEEATKLVKAMFR